jgi:hypothetical protein
MVKVVAASSGSLTVMVAPGCSTTAGERETQPGSGQTLIHDAPGIPAPFSSRSGKPASDHHDGYARHPPKMP